MSKRKGSRTERELIDLLWGSNYAAIRAAGSGVSRFYCPDILASNGSKIFAIECKSTKKNTRYVENKQWTELQKFSDIFGAMPIIALRRDKEGWYFFHMRDLEKTENDNLKIDRKIIELKGKTINEL